LEVNSANGVIPETLKVSKTRYDMGSDNGEWEDIGGDEDMSSQTDRVPTPAADPTCNACGAPATLKCSGCCDAPTADLTEGVPDTWYCSKSCQLARRADHKSQCSKLKERKLVYRAGILMHSIWQTCRLCAFDIEIDSVTVEGDRVIIHHGDGDVSEKKGCLFPFPEHVVEKGAIRDALMNFSTCSDALGWLSSMLQSVLKGIQNSHDFFFDLLRTFQASVTGTVSRSLSSGQSPPSS
jgi:hypothetical protein